MALPDRARHDVNLNSTLIAVSSADGETPISVWADPVTHALLTTGGGGGGGGGTQYNNGDAVVTPIGSVALGYDGANVRAMRVDALGDGFTKITDGTNEVNVLKSDGTAAGYNAVMTAPTGMTVTVNLSSGVLTSQWFDLLNYPWISLEIIANGQPATIAFQTSGDAAQTNVRSMPLLDSQIVNGQPVTSSTSAVTTFDGPRKGRYFRLSSNLTGGNTAQVAITFYTAVASSVVISSNGNVGSNNTIGATAPTSAFLIGMINGAGNLQGAQAGSAIGDGTAANAILSTTQVVYNGTTFDRIRSGPQLGSVLVSAPTATGAAAPANAFYMGILNSGGNLNGVNSINQSGDGASGTGFIGVGIAIYNGATYDRLRGDITNGMDVDVTRVIPGVTATSLGKAEDAAHVSGDTGVSVLFVRNDGNAATLTSADADYTTPSVTSDGSVHVVQQAQTATLGNVTGSATSVTLLSANNARKGGSIYNDSTAVLYVKFGITASTTSFNVLLAAGAYFEINAGYVGRIDGIWASATGTARVMEIT